MFSSFKSRVYWYSYMRNLQLFKILIVCSVSILRIQLQFQSAVLGLLLTVIILSDFVNTCNLFCDNLLFRKLKLVNAWIYWCSLYKLCGWSYFLSVCRALNGSEFMDMFEQVCSLLVFICWSCVPCIPVDCWWWWWWFFIRMAANWLD